LGGSSAGAPISDPLLNLTVYELRELARLSLNLGKSIPKLLTKLQTKLGENTDDIEELRGAVADLETNATEDSLEQAEDEQDSQLTKLERRLEETLESNASLKQMVESSDARISTLERALESSQLTNQM
jgi:hypothetical protein